jgi:hypothetical protein
MAPSHIQQKRNANTIKGKRSFCQISKARFLFQTMLNKATGGKSNV